MNPKKRDKNVELNIINEDNYGAAYTHKKSGFTTRYYTKKQMAALYPQHSYKVAGAIGAVKAEKNIQKESLSLQDGQGHSLPVTRGFAITPATAVIGYVRLKDNVFAAIVKNVALKRLAVAIAGIALLTFGAWCAVNWYDWFPAKIEIDPNAIVTQTTDTPPHEDITIPGYTVIKADKNGTTHWSLQNPEGNPCYFQVTLKLEESNRKLYQSGLMPAGSAIENPKLETMLDPGTYTVLIQYNTYELEGAHNPMNSAVTAGQLIVE